MRPFRDIVVTFFAGWPFGVGFSHSLSIGKTNIKIEERFVLDLWNVLFHMF